MGKRIPIFTVKLVRESSKVYNLESKVIRSPDDAYEIIQEVVDFDSLPKEHFIIATLSNKNEVIGVHTIHVGSLTSSVVHPREVFQQAILNNAAGIIAYHNHPSGYADPSQEDIGVTRRLKEAGSILGIDLMDHLVVGHNGRYTSLKERGLL